MWLRYKTHQGHGLIAGMQWTIIVSLWIFSPHPSSSTCHASINSLISKFSLKCQHFGRPRWVDHEVKRLRPSGQHGETPSLLKIQKISWAWWRVSVISATREAEAGELPELRRRRLPWAEIMPLHSSLGNKSETLSQKNKQTNKQTNYFCTPSSKLQIYFLHMIS